MSKKSAILLFLIFSFLATIIPAEAQDGYVLQTGKLSINAWHFHYSRHSFRVIEPGFATLTVTKITPSKDIHWGFLLINRRAIPLKHFFRGDDRIFERKIKLRKFNRLNVLLKGTPGASIKIDVRLNDVPAPPPVVTFEANPLTIIQGDAGTLTWQTENADSVTIDHNIGAVPVNGSVDITPIETTTYTLTATGPGGATTESVTIMVIPQPTVSISAEPGTITIGESSILTWHTTNADTITIDNGIGTVAAEGSVSVSPIEATTYTVTATGTGGTATDQITVTVEYPVPAVTFSAIPSSVLLGQSSTLSWSSTYADTVEIDQNIGTVETSGTHTILPSSTTTYTLSATGPGGTTTAATTVTVTYPQPLVDLQISPDTITIGASATLSWTSANAVSVSIDNGIGTVGESGNMSVSPTATTTYTITATGVDGATATDSVTLTVNIPAPVISFSANPLTITEGEASILTWSTTDADTVSIDNGVGAVALSGSISVSPAATTTYVLTATGAGGTTTAQVTVTVEPASGDIQVTFEATPSTIALGGSSTLAWSCRGADNAFIDNGVGTVNTHGSVTLFSEHTTVYTITVTGPTGSVSAQAVVTVTASPAALPAGSFGETYHDQIPIDATIAEYDPTRFSLITGLVQDINEAAIEDITISISGHPEYGTAKTDVQGKFSMPVDGGGILTVVYKKPGLITSHRKVKVPWNDIAVVETIQMVAQDPVATTMTFDGNPDTVIVHQGTAFTDAFGTRSATMIFQGDNSAFLVDESGHDVHQLPTIAIRATQYPTPESMPAVLPPTSAYTYCVELRVDGVERVRFDKPVTVWVQNFLGFDVGTVMPVGFYDRDTTHWTPSDNGVVVELLDVDSDGIVDGLDADGDGSPDDLDHDGDEADEVVGLDNAAVYSPGATYSRFSVKHFTPWDVNLGVTWPEGAIRPNPSGKPTADNRPPNGDPCKKRTGSYVEQHSRVFHEDIFVPGTDIALHYSGDRVSDYVTEITVPASGATVPASLKRIAVKVEIAGRVMEQSLSPEPNQMAQFQWDGNNFLGRPVFGPVPAQVKIGFEYEMEYATLAPDGSPAFARSGIIPTGIPAQQFQKQWKRYPLTVYRGKGTLADGWTLSSHHRAYANNLTILFKGDGKQITQAENIISTITGGDCGLCESPPEFGDSGIAADTRIVSPTDVATDAAGNVYIAARDNALILQVDRQGTIRAIAGGGINAGEIEGIPAIEAMLTGPVSVDVDIQGNVYFLDGDTGGTIYKVDPLGIIHIVLSLTAGYSPTDIAVDPEGNVYFSHAWPGRIYKIDNTSDITPVAGADTYDVQDAYGEGGLALDARPGYLTSVALDADGNVYTFAEEIYRILKIDPTGIITTVAGNGTNGYSGDGGQAVHAALCYNPGLALDTSGNLYVSSWSYHRIRRINKSGIIATIIGTGEAGYSGDGALPIKAQLQNPDGIAVAPDGSIYMADFNNHAVRRVSRPINHDAAQADSEVVFVDDNQTGYVISFTGLHDRTIDMKTGRVLQSFEYDAQQRLTAITDQFGNQITVERLSDGTATAIVSPDGLRTELTIDSNNHLVSIQYPDSGVYRFEYTAGGLVTKKTAPEGYQFDYAYDLIGRVTDAYNEEGGHWMFAWTANASGEVKTEVLGGEGGLTSLANHTDANGVITTTIIDPSGNEAMVARSEDGLTVTQSLSCGMGQVFVYDLDPEYKNKYVTELTQTTPAGLTRSTLRSKTYTDTDSDGAPDLMTDDVTVNGKVSTRENNILSSTDRYTSPEGRSFDRVYDPANLLTTSVSTPGLYSTHYAYDSRGRLTTIRIDTRETEFTYDAQGFLETVTDPEGHMTTFSLDAMGRVTGISRPDGSFIGHTYDKNGNMTVLTNPVDVDHTFSYNRIGEPDGYSTPISGTYSYLYDKDRNLIQTNFPSGKQINNIYTATQLTQIQTPEGDIDLTYSCGGKIESMTKTGAAISYSYDGKLLTTVTLSGTLNQSLAYTYNNDFDATAFTYAGGTETLSYDLDGLLTGAGGFTITRNADNGLPEFVSGNGLAVSRAFNGYGELDEQTVNVSSQPAISWSLTRDNAGRIITKSETAAGETHNYGYTYDALGRLLTVTRDSTLIEAYGYDLTSTRTSETNTLRNITGRNLSYSDEDQVLTAGSVTYQYDPDGFLATRTDGAAVTTYSYSSRGELLQVKLPDSRVITYDHDPNRRRIAKRIDGAIVEKYLWQGLTKLLAVFDGSGNLVQRFSYADGRMPVVMTQGGSTYFLAYDQVGTLKVVTDASGNVVKRIDYDTFGNIIADANSALTVPFGFAGGLHDRDTGLVRFGYRDYDPDTGRWTAKDPIFFAGGDTDLYGYVQNNPVNLIDPYGLKDWGKIIGGGAIVAFSVVEAGVGGALIGVGIVEMPAGAAVGPEGLAISIPVGIHTMGLGGVIWGNAAFVGNIGAEIFIEGWNDGKDDPCGGK